MFLVEDEELRLRHDLARYRCLLDSGADDDTDLRLRGAITQTKARLSQLEAVRIGLIGVSGVLLVIALYFVVTYARA